MSNIDIWYGFILGLVGSAVGALIAHFLTKSRNIDDRRIKEFNAAASEFRSAFKDEWLALNPALSSSSVDTTVLLKTAFDKHRLAVFDFRPFLPIESIAGFDKAWKKYYAYDNAPEGTAHGLDKYSGAGHGYKEKKRLRLLAAEQIESLFDFAVHI